mgnify:CR=1 FL=1
MKLRRSPLMIALLAAMALAGCHSKTDAPAAPATVNVQHLNGSTEVKKHPQRIVVLDYCLLYTSPSPRD